MVNSEQVIIKRIQLRRDTFANWLAVDPVLGDGELAYIKDSNFFRVGDGIKKFSEIENLSIEISPQFLQHINDFENPHQVTVEQLSLENVDNVSDINKPISSATQTALDTKVDKITGKGLSEADFTTVEKTKLSNIAENANNYTHPNHSGDVTSTGDGATLISNDVVTNSKLADVPTETIKGRVIASTGDPEDLTVTQVKTLLAITNVDNIADIDKPVSTATQAELDLKLDLSSPAIDYYITNSGSGSYVVNGVSNGNIYFEKGKKYRIHVNASGHPFWIQTVSGAYSSNNIYNTGITNNGTQNGYIIIELPLNVPQLYYACQFHSSMAGAVITGTTFATYKALADLSNVDNTTDANKPISTATQDALNNKVDKVAGKQLSTEDYTSNEKTKLGGIETGAQVNTVTSVSGRTGAVVLTKSDVGLNNVDNVQQAPLTHVGATGNAHGDVTTSVAGFMSSSDKTKLDGIETGSQVNTVTSVATKTGAVTLNRTDVGLDSAITNETDTFASAKIDHIVTLTQAEYDGISPDANTMYVVTDPPVIPTAIQTELDGKEDVDATLLREADIVDNLTSTTTTAPLSANQGKVLQDNKEPAFTKNTGFNKDLGTTAGTVLEGNHYGSGGEAHAVATTSVNGFMVSTDKSKLDGIEAGAEVNDVFSVNGEVGAVIIDTVQSITKLVKNTSGVTLPSATAVRVTGATGENPNVSISNATSLGVPDRNNGDKNIIFGITTQQMTNNSVAPILIKGTLKNVNTSSYTLGDFLFVPATGTTLVTTPPASPAYQICIGLVTKVSADEGEICVNVLEPIHINDITGFDVTRATLVNKQLLVFNGTQFVNRLIDKTDVGLDNVDNTADTAKPVSTSQQTALDGKASIINTSFTGIQVVTQAEYNALTPVATVIYFIKDV